MYLKFSDFISEIKPLSFFKQREQHNRFAHADIYQRKLVHSFVSKSWDERTNFDSAPKAFMAKFFNQKETVLAPKTATFPYQKVKHWKFQKPKSIFTQRGAVRSDRCAPGFLWSTLWDGIEEIECRTLQTPHFQDVLSLFYERQGSDFIADTIPTAALWNLRKPECEVTLSWLEELALFDEHQPPSRQQSLKAINYIIRGRKNISKHFKLCSLSRLSRSVDTCKRIRNSQHLSSNFSYRSMRIMASIAWNAQHFYIS